MAGASEIGEASENPIAINVIPLVDVIFCLCVFFMCSFHFKQLEGKIETWMPKDGPYWGGGCVTILEEIRVRFSVDPASGRTQTCLGRLAVRDDAELTAGIQQRSDDYRRAGRSRIPVLLDAEKDVPWTDVVHVLDLCRSMGLSEVEFTAPGP